MRAWMIVAILFLGLIALWAGCSLTRGGLTSPDATGTDNPQAEGPQVYDDTVWGIYEVTVDGDEMTIETRPLRSTEMHVNATEYVLPPLCPDCISGKINGFNPVNRIMNLQITLHNDTEYDAFDVRGILFLDGSKGHKLANPDGYTTRLDKSDPKDINPYIIWKEGGDEWQFPSGAELSEEVQVVMPTPMSFSVDFAILASFPGHSKDPLEIEDMKADGHFHDTGWAADIDVKVFDWQNDVSSVYIDLSPFGAGNKEYPMTLDADNYWKVHLQYNPATDGALPKVGKYLLPIRVVDKQVTPNMYDYIEVEVTKDVDPPTWVKEVGITDVAIGAGRAVIYHAIAEDPSAPVNYYLYYSQSSNPYEGDYVKVTGAAHYAVAPLINGMKYIFGVRAGDQANNIDDNMNYRYGTPEAIELLWARTVAAEINSDPNLADLDGDSDLEVVFGCDDGKVVALDGTTGEVGWYLATGGSVVGSPALVDINFDGLPDVVVGSGDGKLYGIRGTNGTNLGTYQTQNIIQASPVICDYGENGTPDVFLASTDKRVYGINILTLTVFALYNAEYNVVATPCLAYLNGDKYPDVIVCSGGVVHAVSGSNAKDLWSVNLGMCLFEGSPVAAVLDGDSICDIVVGTVSGVYAMDGTDGSILWSRTDLDVDFETSPALGDLTGDGTADVVISGRLAGIYAFDGKNGNLLWQAEGSPIKPTSPAIIDVTGDGKLDVVAGSLDGHMRIYNGDDGLILGDFFLGLAGGVTTTPAIWDINHDGYVDIVFGTQQRTMIAITTNKPLPTSAALAPWPRFHRNRFNQGNLAASLNPSW